MGPASDNQTNKASFPLYRYEINFGEIFQESVVWKCHGFSWKESDSYTPGDPLKSI